MMIMASNGDFWQYSSREGETIKAKRGAFTASDHVRNESLDCLEGYQNYLQSNGNSW